MKRFYLLMVILLINLSVIGQYITEGFETSVPPTGWTLYQVTGSNGWVQTTSQVHSGVHSAYVDDVSGAADSWLITDVIDLSSSTTPKLYYYEYVAYSSWAEEHNVLISIDYSGTGDPTLATWTTLNSTIGSNDTWVEIGPIDLSSYKSSTVYIAWQYVGDYASEWYIDDVLVEEPASCLAPTADSTRNITQTTADVYWTENGSATEWQVEYGPQGYTAGNGTKVTPTVVDGDDTTISGLSANTSYDWYVRAICAVGDTSPWSNGLSFTTLCNTVTSFPFQEGFENSGNIPDCWIQEYRIGSNDWEFTTGVGFGHPSSAHSGTYNAAFTHSTTGNATKLVSPTLDLSSLTAPRIKFWRVHENWSGDQDTLRVYYKTSTAGTWTLIPGAEYFNNQDSWTEEVLMIPNPSSTYLIAFEGIDDYGYGVGIDDVTVEESPSCLSPTADSTNNVTQTSADVYWTENGSATEWQVEFGPKGYTAGTGTIVTPTVVDGDDTTINGLNHSTDYDWYVRSICGPGDTSQWSNGISFTTACGAISSFPYTQNFDAWASSSPSGSCTPDGSVSLESCWENATGDDIDWDILTGSTSSASTGPSGDHTSGSGKYIYTEASSCYASTGYVLTSEFDFTGVFPALTFWYHMYGSTMGTLSLQASTDGGNNWSSDLWSLSGDQGDSWQKAEVNIGSYYNESSVIFRFTGLTGSSYYSDMAIDDFSLTALTDPTISVTPDSVNYGECPLNNLSSEYYTQEFVVRNIGPGTLTINSVSITGTDASEFDLDDNNSYPAGLSGNDSIVFTVKFDPQTTGDKEASLNISTPSRADHDYPLLGEAYVAPAQNLSGLTTGTYTNELDWDPPLPEGEIRYDNGVITNWYWVNSPSSEQHYFYTRITAPVAGDLEYISLFTRHDGGGTGWNQIMICPEDGSGNADLTSPYETFNNVGVSSAAGEWVILQLSTPESLTQGTEFFIVTRWPDGSNDGPFVGTNLNENSGRCGFSSDGGTTWVPFAASFIMRAYMTTSRGGSQMLLAAGKPVPELGQLDVQTVPTGEFGNTVQRNRELNIPGVYEKSGSRDLTDYTVHRGTTSQTYSTSFTGITDTEYSDTDAALTPGTEYFYAVTANYSGGMVSDTSNEVSVTLLDLPTAPTNPDPADAASDIQPDTDLEWQNNGNVQNIDLYLSKTQDSVTNKWDGTAKKLDNVSVTDLFDPGILDEDTWYWRVVARDGVSTEVDGPVWSFDVNDIIGPDISYSPLDNTTSTSARTLVDTIRDISGVPTSGSGLPVLYWKIGVNGTWNSSTGTYTGNNEYSFTFGSGVSTGDTVYYYSVAQDNSSNKNVAAMPAVGAGSFSSDPPAAGTPPTNPEYYIILGAFSGTKTIGSSGDYASLTNNGGLFEALNNGALTGNLEVKIAGNLTEDGTHPLDEIFMEGGTFSVTIMPDAPTAYSIAGTYDGDLIRLSGADNITIDGSSGGNGRYLTFENHYLSRSSVTIDVSNNANNINIKNCNIYSTYRGITTSATDGVTVKGNNIYGDETGNSNYSQAGIYLGSNSLNNTIEGNLIHDFYYTGTGGWGCTGIYFETGDATSQSEIINNVIFNIKADGWSDNASPLNPNGIYISNGGMINIWHNSIYLEGSVLSDTYDCWPACIAIESSVTDLDIRNNILKNSLALSSGSQPSSTFAIVSEGSSAQFSMINHNDYHVDGIDPQIGYLGTKCADLASWQAATEQDENSMVADPQFTGTLLQLTDPGSPAIGEGGILPAVTTDIDGNNRHEYFPTIGAREYEASFVGIWTGAVDDDWSDSGNWDFNPPGTPTSSSNVAIPTSPSGGNFPNVPNGFTARCKKMYIETGATVNVEDGGTLIVED